MTSAVTVTDPGRSFRKERLQHLRALEDWHFWFDGRRRVVLRLIANARLPPDAVVVDVGCGTGSLIRDLRSRRVRAIGMDPYASAATGVPVVEAPRVSADGRSLPLGSASCDAVVTLDVLEHTDDVAMLRELRRILHPGGTLILTVPALPALWSAQDERAGHLRRYTRSSLHERVEAAGFAVEESLFYQCLLLPLYVAVRSLSARRRRNAGPERPGLLVNRILRWITRLEVGAGRWITWPIGSTLALRCRRLP